MTLTPRIRTTLDWLVTVASVLLALELCTRLFTKMPDSGVVRDERIGARFERSLDLLRYNAESDRMVPMRTNTQGFRDDEWARDKPAGIRRIAVFGDSYIAGAELPKNQIMVSRLEQLLNSSEGSRCQVMNFGVGGSSTGQQLVLYRELASRFDLDVVIIGFGTSSDVSDNSGELSSNPILRCRIGDNEQLETVRIPAAQRYSSRFLNRYSRFYDWQKRVVNRFVKQVRQGVQPLETRPRVYNANPDPRFQRAWKLTERILEQFRIETSRDGAALLVVSIPESRQVYRDQFERLMQQAGEGARMEDDFPDTRLAAICQRSGIPYLSLLPAFRAAAPDRDSQVLSQRLFLKGMGHFNQKGHDLAAGAISEWLGNSKTLQIPGTGEKKAGGKKN